jgi:hypothetical protein
MAELKTRLTGLRAKLPRGSEVFGVLSEDGEFVCYSLTSTDGVKTNIALSDEALGAMLHIHTKLHADGVAPSVPGQQEGGA